MKAILTTIMLIAFATSSYGQGYGLSAYYYTEEIPQGKFDDQGYWSKQVKKITKKSNKNPSDANLLYKLAVATEWAMLKNEPYDAIALLDRAIEIDSSQVNYYIVRGIIKMDWGSYSSDYDGLKSCDDFKKAMEIGIPDTLLLDVEFSQILKMCEPKMETLLGHNRSALSHENFNESAADITWRNDIVKKSVGEDSTENYYILHITDSSYQVKIHGSVHYEITCLLETQIANNLFKFRSFQCEKRMGVQTIFGFFEDGNLYLAFKQFDLDLNSELLQIIENDHGWKKFYPVIEKE